MPVPFFVIMQNARESFNNHDTSWTQTDRVLGEGKVGQKQTRIRMCLQQSSAEYRDDFLEDFAQLAAPEGLYVTVRAMPFPLCRRAQWHNTGGGEKQKVVLILRTRY